MIIDKIDYPDGSFYTKILPSNERNGDADEFYHAEYDGRLTFRINSYNDLWHLAQIKDALDNENRKVHLTIPCLLDAQHDRRFKSNESHNLRLICKFINDMQWESVSVFHPHNQEVVEALIDNVKIIDNLQFISDVIDKIGLINNKIGNLRDEVAKDTILLSTDAGGFKPLMKLADKLNWQGEVYSASKSRKFENGESKLIQVVDRQDFGGKNILIIDDISVFAGTFVGLAKLLKERNVGKLYLAVSHITVHNPNPELWTLFDKVFTTNSKGYDYSYFGKPRKNLEIIKMFED